DTPERVADDQQFAVGVDAERADVPELRKPAELRRVFDDLRGARFAVCVERQRQRKQTPLDEIGKEVTSAIIGRKPIAAIHIATGDRLPHAVAVLMNGFGQRLKRDRQRRDVVVGTFAIAPAVIASAASPRFVVDLFPPALANVAYNERTGATTRGIVERVAPGVSESERP